MQNSEQENKATGNKSHRIRHHLFGKEIRKKSTAYELEKSTYESEK